MTDGPEFHNAETTGELHQLRVTITAWGQQRTRVDTHIGDEHDRYVVVAVGRVILYVHSRRALESIADAWVDAVVTADKLRLTYENVPSTWHDEEQTIAVSAHARVAQPHQILGVGAAASPNGYAHVAVTLGNMTYRLYDLTALEAFASAWSDALELSGVFGAATPAFQALRIARRKALP